MKRILCGALSALLIFTGIQLPVRAETAGTEETAAVQPEETAATEPEETAATEPVESVPVETQAPETIGPDANERAPQAMTVSGSGIAAGLHIAPVLGGQGLQDHSDLHIAGSGGIAAVLLGSSVIGAGVFVGGISAAAGHQRQGHHQCEEKCKKLFHLTSFLLLNWFPLTFRQKWI